ncbi:hypothetical protein [Mangrovibacter plantisponsor]|uniref:Uncharacterized protein n=1 Tax=Mangrovibacter plantisponsor TaxID=451513 RepID=A0A317PZ34_9ENTR|nr:hypothetical protein [Mangrovibacter plantisponsor]PWW04961.1 hypothetical protein DES37_11457 [Mangrovibacter plantisponsor]
MKRIIQEICVMGIVLCIGLVGFALMGWWFLLLMIVLWGWG